MSANTIESQMSFSFSSETTTYNFKEEGSAEATNSSQRGTDYMLLESLEKSTTIIDSFQRSEEATSQPIAYTQPRSVMLSQQASSERITVRQNFFTPQGNKELEEDINRQLSSFFGEDTPEYKKHQDTFKQLKELDPELANKAMFLLTLMEKEDAEKFMNDMSTFARQANGVATDVAEANVVATANVSATTDFRSEAIANANNAVEGFAAKFSVDFNMSVKINGTGIFNPNGRVTDPLVFDLSGDGINLKSEQNGVEFDIDGDGTKEQTAFIQGDDALLYLDKSGNGIADNGNELFGDQEGDANGYAKLAKHDENNDGVIDKLDSVYSKLRLWQDKNDDGYNQLTESMSLLEAGIKSIQLKYDELNECDGKGNIIGQSSGFTRTDGSKGYSADMYFKNSSPAERVSNLLI